MRRANLVYAEDDSPTVPEATITRLGLKAWKARLDQKHRRGKIAIFFGRRLKSVPITRVSVLGHGATNRQLWLGGLKSKAWSKSTSELCQGREVENRSSACRTSITWSTQLRETERKACLPSQTMCPHARSISRQARRSLSESPDFIYMSSPLSTKSALTWSSSTACGFLDRLRLLLVPVARAPRYPTPLRSIAETRSCSISPSKPPRPILTPPLETTRPLSRTSLQSRSGAWLFWSLGSGIQMWCLQLWMLEC